ncbi:nickel ABC transporter permease [Methanocaldococcus sp.]
MKKYIIKRILQMIPTLIGASFISFSLLYLFPGDPAEFILQINMGIEPSPEEIENFRKEAGLDKPLIIQYLNWLYNVLHGDFGTSWSTGKPVLKEIMDRVPISAELFFPTLILSIISALLLGIISALYRDKLPDHISRIWSLIGISVPSFWLGLMLIWIFSVNLKLLPSYGVGSIKHAILPILTWTISFMAIKTRFVRAVILDILNEDYILTARAKGLSESAIVIKHALRNALIPILTYFSMSLSHLIVGSIMVEVVFAWPGLGSLLVESVLKRDFPVVQALVFLSAVLFLVVNFIVDILYALIDPRIRYES